MDMSQEGARAPNLQNELATFVRERVEKRKYCMIFENRLEPCWPAEKVKTAPRIAREKEIHAFAKANGWTAIIHDPGLSDIQKRHGLMATTHSNRPRARAFRSLFRG